MAAIRMALRAEPSASSGSTISGGGGLSVMRSSAASTLAISPLEPSSRPRTSSSDTISWLSRSSTSATSISASLTRCAAAISAAFCLVVSPSISAISALSWSMRSWLSEIEDSTASRSVWVGTAGPVAAGVSVAAGGVVAGAVAGVAVVAGVVAGVCAGIAGDWVWASNGKAGRPASNAPASSSPTLLPAPQRHDVSSTGHRPPNQSAHHSKPPANHRLTLLNHAVIAQLSTRSVPMLDKSRDDSNHGRFPRT